VHRVEVLLVSGTRRNEEPGATSSKLTDLYHKHGMLTLEESVDPTEAELELRRARSSAGGLTGEEKTHPGEDSPRRRHVHRVEVLLVSAFRVLSFFNLSLNWSRYARTFGDDGGSYRNT